MVDTVVLRTLNNHVGNFLRRVVEGLSNEQIHYSAPAIDERPITELAVHAYCGTLRFANAVAGKGRSEMPPVPATTADLLTLLVSTHEQLDAILADLPDGALEKMYKMPWGQELSGANAFAGALAHGLVHAGHIQGIRAIGGFPTPPEN